MSAFRPESDILNSPYAFPERLTLANFQQLARLPGFYGSLVNSAVTGLGATILTALAALPSGYVLSRYRFRGSFLLRMGSLIGYMFAPAVLALPYFQILSALGLVDTVLGIALTHVAFCFPFAISVSYMVFRSVPLDLEQVAMLDGRGLWNRFLHVVLPASKHQVSGLVLLVFSISWKEFFFAFLLSSGSRSRTLPVMLATLYGGEALNWHILAALSIVLLLPSIIVLFFSRLGRAIPLLGAGSRG